MIETKTTNFVYTWLRETIKNADFFVQEIPLSKSREWLLKNGAVEHKTGRFFRVIGLEWLGAAGKTVSQPFLDQHEIGTLGFLIEKRGGETKILVQAKIEPGNLGIVQLAPTCQSTASNAKRAHGGEKPPFIGVFSQKNKSIVYDKLQSEQGTRFFDKRNRNVLAVVGGDKFPNSPSHRWIPIEDMLGFLKNNYLVNTDARSVLVSAPWHILVDHAPFSRFSTGFGAELAKSYATLSAYQLEKARQDILLMRAKTPLPKQIDISKLKNWKVTKGGIFSKSKNSFDIKQIMIKVNGREVPYWDQPIVTSKSAGKVILFCARENGVLKFLFRASGEAGLHNKVELTPSVVIEPGSTEKNNFDFSKGAVCAECYQSEEGGRFYHDINHFQIVDTGDIKKTPGEHYWLTLGEIRHFLDEEGWFTNEARSALSLLLQWL